MSGHEALIAELRAMDACSRPEGCVCGGDTPRVRAGCGWFVKDFAPHRAAEALRSTSVDNGKLVEALTAIVGGDVPRPIGKPWRSDGKRSKLDECIHSRTMSEDCAGCIEAFAASALRSSQPIDHDYRVDTMDTHTLANNGEHIPLEDVSGDSA